jgi:hypothetical protein
MIRTVLICALVSASAAGCATPQARTDTQVAAVNHPCAVQSGSRLPVRPGECNGLAGRSYSQDDMERTGKTNVGDALQLLDPSLSVHH